MNGNRAVLYLRLSKEDADKVSKGDDSASIKNQRLLLTDYALAHQFQIVKIYSDDDESGLYDDRPDFEKMMTDAKLGEFDIIIAKTQSRFSRNMEHIERYLHHDLPNLGIRFIGVVDGVDTDIDSNKKSRQINGLVNEWYCEDLSKNIRSSFRIKMQNGQFLGSSCPYGYQKDPKNHNHLVIDPYAAEIVRRIYKMYVSGYGKTKIAATLSTEGILIPTRYKREVLGENYYNSKALPTTRHWSYQTIHTILNNETYAGHLVQNKVNTFSYKDKKKKAMPKEKWITVRNTHEAIIDQELFELAQKLQKTRSRTLDQTEENGIFSGLMYCADCKHAMVRKYARNRGEAIGFICRTYKTYGKQFCTSHSIHIKELQEALLASVREEARSILGEEEIRELSDIQSDTENADSFAMMFEKVQKRKERVLLHRQKTYENFVEGLITKEEYLEYKNRYERELEELEKHQSLLLEQMKLQKEENGKFDAWVESFKDYINIEELTRDVVLELIDKIEVNCDSSITIYYKFFHPQSDS